MNSTQADILNADQGESQGCGYWSKARAAAYLDVKPYTIDYLTRLGRLPYYLIAGKRRYTRADLDAYAAGCRVSEIGPKA